MPIVIFAYGFLAGYLFAKKQDDDYSALDTLFLIASEGPTEN